jgi:F-type H+-transporting ATPase subunit a
MIAHVQVEVFSILIITSLLLVIFYFLGTAFNNADFHHKPNYILTLGLSYHAFISNLVKDNMGSRAIKVYGPYIGALALYLVFSNLSGLTGIASPTANYSVTLSLALITFVMLQYTKISINGFKNFLLGFLDPFPPFIIPNLFGFIAPLISMSLRLFGNLTAGSVIMGLIYVFTGFLSSFVPWIGKFNFIGVFVTPVLHAYFDVFSGLIQTYIFISLTTIFIGNELPQD